MNASRREPLGLKGSMNFHFSVLMVWAFAGGEHGRLGLNDEDDRLVLTRVGPQRFGGPQVAAAGLSHSAAVTEGG